MYIGLVHCLKTETFVSESGVSMLVMNLYTNCVEECKTCDEYYVSQEILIK